MGVFPKCGVHYYRIHWWLVNKSTVDTELKHVYSLIIDPKSGYEIVKTHFVYTFKDSLENVNNWRQFETFIVKDGKIQRWSASGQEIVEETE